jgi:hypothetical protein
MELSNRNVVKMGHSLNTAKYSLTPVETDIILKMVAEIRNEDEDFKPYSFKVTDLEAYFGKQLNSQSLKKMAQELRKKNLTIDLEGGGFLVTGWISSFEYKPKMGLIELAFDPKLKPYLLQLQDELYLKTDLRNILQLPSEYAKRIYMLLKQWELKGSLEVEIAEWQRILEVPKSMKSYGDFKRKGLDVAERYINEKTDLRVSYEPKKTGRAYTHLIWTIRTKPSTRRNELDSFKLWFGKNFQGYPHELAILVEGTIFLNDKDYFYDFFDKRKRFDELAIERIWMQLLDRKEDLKDSLRQWEYEKKKRLAKKLVQEEVVNPNQASLPFDSEIDCHIEEVPPPKLRQVVNAYAQKELIKELEKYPENEELSEEVVTGLWQKFSKMFSRS